MADYFVVKCITRLHTVDNHTFLIVTHARNHGNGLVVVNVERFLLGLDLLHAQSFKGLDELMVDQFHTLFDGLRILGLVSQGTLEVIQHRQDGRNGFLATVKNQFSLLLDGALAVVLELSASTQILVFELGDFFLGFFQRGSTRAPAAKSSKTCSCRSFS